MPKAGQVRVRLTKDQAAASGAWLLARYLEGGNGQRLPSESDARRAQALGQQLLKMARRRRTLSEFTAYVDRALAEWFAEMSWVVIYRGVIIRGSAPSGVRDALKCFERAVTVCRGRARLWGMPVAKRATGLVRYLDLRQRKRMARRVRYERAWAEWSARRNSIAGSAGSDDPPPKNLT